MREQRLTERLRTWKSQPNRRFSEDPGKTIDSVMAHLQRILNTRQGNVPIAEDYGVPDFTSLLEGYPNSLLFFERAIRDTIEKYEPRLKSVSVHFQEMEDDLLSLRFQINGELAVDEHSDPVFFESIMGSDGKIRIRR